MKLINLQSLIDSSIKTEEASLAKEPVRLSRFQNSTISAKTSRPNEFKKPVSRERSSSPTSSETTKREFKKRDENDAKDFKKPRAASTEFVKREYKNKDSQTPSRNYAPTDSDESQKAGETTSYLPREYKKESIEKSFEGANERETRDYKRPDSNSPKRF